MPKFSAESLRGQYFWAVHLSDGLPCASETTLSKSSPSFAQSAVIPSVTTHRTGTPRAQKCFLDRGIFCTLIQGYAEKSQKLSQMGRANRQISVLDCVVTKVVL